MSFYYVTLEYVGHDTAKHDLRKVRKSCTFGQGTRGKHRFIYEETVSFLLCGHLDEAFSCYQLVDTYFRPHYNRSTGPRAFRSCDPKQSPGQFLLYWIAVALFHARYRWENAIDALDTEIRSPVRLIIVITCAFTKFIDLSRMLYSWKIEAVRNILSPTMRAFKD